MLDLLKPEIERFIAQKPEYNREVILASTLSAPVTRSTRYRPEFADYLADSVEKVLQ